MGGDVSGLVPEFVDEKLKEKFLQAKMLDTAASISHISA